jgi:tRNA threonylcarbamoyladenosine biosynthesis protein TsaE
MKLRIENETQIEEAAKKILDYAGEKKIWLFYGEMGAGKTTLIKSICKLLGVKSELSSPTFSIVNEYHTESEKKIFHFDLYRLKNTNELKDIGFEEYLFSGNYCFIEWPELALEFLDNVHLKISIEENKGVRNISVD